MRIVAASALLSSLAAPPSRADDGPRLTRLRIGMVARPGAGTVFPGVAAIERAYSVATGLPVAVFVARDLPALIEAQAGGRIDYAVHSAVSYAVASRLCGCIEPIAAPLSVDGSRGIRRIMVVRAGTAPGAAPKRIAVQAGADPLGRLLPPAATSATLVEADAPGGAERMFAGGEADALLGWMPASPSGEPAGGGSLARLAAAGLEPSDYEIAWESELVPFGPHAVASAVPAPVKEALRRFLEELLRSDPDLYDLVEGERQGGFAPATRADYAVVLDLVERIAAAPGR